VSREKFLTTTLKIEKFHVH